MQHLMLDLFKHQIFKVCGYLTVGYVLVFFSSVALTVQSGGFLFSCYTELRTLWPCNSCDDPRPISHVVLVLCCCCCFCQDFGR